MATEAKTDQERRDQAYGVEESNPSVIALNAISSAHAVNDFMLDYLGLRAEVKGVRYEQFNCLNTLERLWNRDGMQPAPNARSPAHGTGARVQ